MKRRTLILTLTLTLLPVVSLAQDKPQPVDAEGHQWWQHAVFYEIYPRSFADSNNDGIGDLNGITSKLDYLHDLGVDAIWITPCFPSPQVDFGYDVSDYENIDPMYGTLADFDVLVAEATRSTTSASSSISSSTTPPTSTLVSRFQIVEDRQPSRLVHLARRQGPGQPPNNWISDLWRLGLEVRSHHQPVLLPLSSTPSSPT